jgi:hypothetical protein
VVNFYSSPEAAIVFEDVSGANLVPVDFWHVVKP